MTWVRDSQAPCAEDLLPRTLAGVVEPLGAIVAVHGPLNRPYEGLLTPPICATLIRGLNNRATQLYTGASRILVQVKPCFLQVSCLKYPIIAMELSFPSFSTYTAFLLTMHELMGIGWFSHFCCCGWHCYELLCSGSHSSILFKMYLLIVCFVCIYECLHVCTCTMEMPGAHRGQNRTSVPCKLSYRHL